MWTGAPIAGTTSSIGTLIKPSMHAYRSGMAVAMAMPTALVRKANVSRPATPTVSYVSFSQISTQVGVKRECVVLIRAENTS